jgi:hypothetical protein
VKIPFSPPDITELELRYVEEAMRSGWITTGPRSSRQNCPLSMGRPRQFALILQQQLWNLFLGKWALGREMRS